MIAVLGDVAVDIRSDLSKPLVRGSDAPASIRLALGGSAANVAVRLARSDVAVTLIGRVGDDLFGRWAQNHLTHEGVITHLAIDPDRPTAVVQVLVEPDGERTMVPDRGASGRWRPDDLPVSLLEDMEWLHLTAYSLFDPGSREAAITALRTARNAGIPVSLDAGSHAPLAQMGALAFWSLAEHVEILFANRDEALTLGWRPESTDPFADLMRHAETVVVKLDREGCTAKSPTQSICRPPPQVFSHRDSTGAGDAFAAGFLARWSESHDLAAACDAAVRYGTQHVGGERVTRSNGEPTSPGAPRGDPM